MFYLEHRSQDSYKDTMHSGSSSSDPELDALQTIARLFEPLDESTRRRVVFWLRDRYVGPSVAMPPRVEYARSATASAPAQVAQDKMPTSDAGPIGRLSRKFSALPDLFYAASPKTDADKALVVAAWIQETSDEESLEGFKVNRELKHLGHGVSNITRCFDLLMEKQPAEIIQLRKSGSSQQARKTYKVTEAGIRRVAEMINTQVSQA